MKAHFLHCKIYLNDSANQNDQIIIEMKLKFVKILKITTIFSNFTTASLAASNTIFEFDLIQSSLRYVKFTVQNQVYVNHRLIMRIYCTDSSLKMLQHYHFKKTFKTFNVAYKMFDRDQFDEFLLNAAYDIMSTKISSIVRKNKCINFFTNDSNNINQDRIINLFCNINDIFYYLCNEDISNVKHETNVLIQ